MGAVVARARSEKSHAEALWPEAKSKALLFLGKQWRRYEAEHEDIVADCWGTFAKAFDSQRTKDATSAAAWLVNAVKKRLLTMHRDTSNRAKIRADAKAAGVSLAPRKKGERLPRGYGRLPGGRLYRRHSTDGATLRGEPQRVIASVRDRPGVNEFTPITPELARAVFDLAWLVDKYVERTDEVRTDEGGYEYSEKIRVTDISRADGEAIAAAFRGAFGHRIADAADVRAAWGLILGLEYAHEIADAEEGTGTAHKDVRSVLSEPLPPWATDTDLDGLYLATTLNAGGRGRKNSKTVETAVLAYVNDQRKIRGLPRWRSLPAVGIAKAPRANSRR